MKIKYNVHGTNKEIVLAWLEQEGFEFRSIYSSGDKENTCPTYWKDKSKRDIVLLHPKYVRKFFINTGVDYTRIKNKQHLFELLNIKL